MIDNHTQFITLADRENSNTSLILHLSDVDAMCKELKKRQKEMTVDSIKRKANGS